MSNHRKAKVEFVLSKMLALYPVLVRRIKFPTNGQGWQSGCLTRVAVFWEMLIGETDHVYESLESHHLGVCTWRRKDRAPHLSCFGQLADL